MARKLLMDTDRPDNDRDAVATDDSPTRPARRSSLVTGGAAAPQYVEASARSKADRTHKDIQLDQIQDSLIEDRIDINEGLDELAASIDKNGQQIPIIVRIVNKDKPYEIVAGRRRIAALRRLGRTTVRGYITRMTDREAFLAQGIENSARLETSFIERARTIVKATDAGFSQRDMAEFLNVSQTLVNFMSRIYEALGDQLVVAIGPARGVGRRKWEMLVSAFRDRSISTEKVISLVDTSIADSSERFEALLSTLQAAPAPGSRSRSRAAVRPPAKSKLMEGKYSVLRKPGQLLLKAAGRDAPADLLDYISDRLPDLVLEYQQSKEDAEEDSD